MSEWQYLLFFVTVAKPTEKSETVPDCGRNGAANPSANTSAIFFDPWQADKAPKDELGEEFVVCGCLFPFHFWSLFSFAIVLRHQPVLVCGV